ncbi:MAG: fasciclin domain-containing protein [Roseiflexaceae bacterium]|nr:fasciclin domain-containing protein [Roseiflexaceae bacterium]
MKRLMMGGLALLTAATLAACGAPTTSTGTGSTSATAASGTTGSTTGTATTGDTSSTGGTTATSTASGTTATATGASTTGTATGATGNSIVDVATDQGNFTVLLTALQATGLDQTLSQAGEYTVFAPTDDAFAALPPATLQALLADPATLTKILQYHVVAGEVPAADVVSATSLTSLEGQDIAVTVSGSTVTLNGDTTVTATDIATSNGVIHVIDKVLLPPDVTLPS